MVIKAVKRLIWRFKSKSFVVNDNDIQALQDIAEYVEKTQKQQFEQNETLAKLFVIVYAQYLKKYNTTVFDEIPQKEMYKLLDKPLNYFIQLFTDRLNESELYTLFNDLNIELTHPATKTIETKQKELNALKTHEKRILSDVWDYETVQDNLILQINQFINNFGK